MTTGDGGPIEVGYIIGYNANHWRSLTPGVPIPTMEWAQVLEIDEADDLLAINFQDGCRANIHAGEVLAAASQEEWERQYGKTWQVKTR